MLLAIMHAQDIRAKALVERKDGTFRLAAPRPALELAGRWSWAGDALERLPDYAPLVERMKKAASLSICKISGKMKLATTFFRGGF